MGDHDDHRRADGVSPTASQDDQALEKTLALQELNRSQKRIIELVGMLNRALHKEDILTGLAHKLRVWMGCGGAGVWLLRPGSAPWNDSAGFAGHCTSCLRMLEEDRVGPARRESALEVLTGLCAATIRGELPADLPFVTPRGNLWARNRHDIQAATILATPPPAPPSEASSNPPLDAGSLVLVAIHSREAAHGLIQCCDQREGFFSEAAVAFLETIADHLALGIDRMVVGEKLDAGLRERTALIDAMGDGLIIRDPEGVVVQVNRAALALLGCREDQVVGQPLAEVLRSRIRRERHDTIEHYDHETARGAVSPHQVFEVDAGGGQVRFISCTTAFVHDGAGRLASVILNIKDITELKQAEERLKALNEELEKRVKLRTTELEASNQELQSFVYSVSHDLRAPLRVIEGFSQAMQEDCKDALDDNGLMYLERIREGARRMGALIEDLLELSRIARQDVHLERVHLSQIARDIVAQFRVRDPHRRVDFQCEANLFADGDPGLLRIALENLLGNAWKYTATTGNAVVEFHRTDLDGGNVYIVRDNGVGFDMKYAGKLFKPFQRLHSSQVFEGTGVGLATVARIIKRHGGRIWAEGAEGEGAVFYFTL